MHAPFVAFEADHWAALGLVVVASLFLIGLARVGRWPRFRRACEWVLAGLLVSSWPAEWLSAIYVNHVTWEEVLPLHLCDLASFTGAAALIGRRQLAAELTYFWAVAGTVNGLITPTVKYAFPHPSFFAFFLLHCSVVTTAAYVIGGLRLWPAPGAVRRVFLTSLAYLGGIAVVNWVLGTNFAFIRQKPESASLLDMFGAWPWYVLFLIPFAFAVFSLLYLPFWIARRLQAPPAPLSPPEKTSVQLDP